MALWCREYRETMCLMMRLFWTIPLFNLLASNHGLHPTTPSNAKWLPKSSLPNTVAGLKFYLLHTLKGRWNLNTWTLWGHKPQQGPRTVSGRNKNYWKRYSEHVYSVKKCFQGHECVHLSFHSFYCLLTTLTGWVVALITIQSLKPEIWDFKGHLIAFRTPSVQSEKYNT